MPCNVIVAQPRRISAMSVAERIAQERGEQIGGTVGYSIRLDNKKSAATRLLFCTTGILLKRLEGDKDLQNVSASERSGQASEASTNKSLRRRRANDFFRAREEGAPSTGSLETG